MSRSSSLAITILAVGLVVGATALAQKPAVRPTQTTPRERDDKIGVLDVRLPITAKKDKKFLPGLTVNNFEVYEDGKRQKIEKFVSPSQLPLNIGLLVDTKIGRAHV